MCRAAAAAQLWPVAIVIARLLGDAATKSTVQAMASCVLVSGSPLHTLCLIIAGDHDSVLAPASPGAQGAPQQADALPI